MQEGEVQRRASGFGDRSAATTMRRVTCVAAHRFEWKNWRHFRKEFGVLIDTNLQITDLRSTISKQPTVAQ